jgi:hypothetical protein
MGNKPGSRRKQSAAGDVSFSATDDGGGGSGTMKRSKSSQSNSNSSGTQSERDKKMISCPDLSSNSNNGRSATGNGRHIANGDTVSSPPGGAGGGLRQMEIKIYRSYTNVSEASRKPEARPDIRCTV